MLEAKCNRLQKGLSYQFIRMPREAEPSINERAFILQALQENVRLDGRAFDAYRQLDVSFGEEYGIADVRLGKTRYEFVTPRY